MIVRRRAVPTLVRCLVIAAVFGATGCDGRIFLETGGPELPGPGDPDSGSPGPDGGSPPDGGMSGPDAGVACAPLPPPTGQIHRVRAGIPDDFATATASANAGDTILVEDGTYLLGGRYILLSQAGVTLRSESGNRDAVILDGQYSTAGPQVITVGASNVTIADLTIKRAYTHPIHINTAVTNSGHLTNVRVYNVHIVDPGEQAIKVNSNGGFNLFVDDGEIACSHIELTATGRPSIRNNCYTGGIDVHAARSWRVHDNLIEGFWCASGLSEHGIHFWKGTRDIVVERNVLRNNARGIGFGLSNGVIGRTYPDAPCGAGNLFGNYAGIIRNNGLLADDPALFASEFGADTGIALESSCADTQVVHNTLFFTQSPFSAIEWRFPATTATVINNLTSHRRLPRDGATATEQGNVDTATAGFFVNAPGGDLHLTAAASAALGQGVPASTLAPQDIDGQTRSTSAPDVGADERP